MVPIADSGLRHVRDQRRGITPQKLHGRTKTAELIAEQFGLEPEAVSSALYHRTAGRRVATHEQRNAENALVANKRDFSGRPIFHDVEQRNDGCRWEIHVRQRAPWFVENLTKRHRYQF